MPTNVPSHDFLAAQVRWAMGRGLPAQVAEDVVFEAWEKASATFDPRRGAFEAYMQRVVRNGCHYWWRTQGRAQRAEAHLKLVPSEVDSRREEQAAQHQQALLDALTPEEREVFAAWALQKHLGKGRVTSVEMSGTLGMDVPTYENAKRRLRAQLQRLLDRFGWSVAQLLRGDDHVDRTG
ncbi:MAG: sigma factor [Myxococcota bacterium]